MSVFRSSAFATLTRNFSGRNVCRYYLIGVCKFGEKCAYSHSKEFLLQKSWWSTAEGIDKMKKIYVVQQKFKQAFIDYEKKNKTSSNSEPGLAPKKKRTRGKNKRVDHARSNIGRLQADATAAGRARSESGQSSHPSNSNVQTKHTVYSYSSPEEDDSEYGDEERMLGFTDSELEELLCHGIKPWDV